MSTAPDPALAIDVDSTVPPYEQVRAGLAERIVDGRLPVGTRLPTVRALAGELELAVNTVARAYRELEAAGLVRTQGRAGTFVHTADAARETVRQAAEQYVRAVRAAGLDLDDGLAAVRTAFGS